LFILTDDQRFDAVGYRGNQVLKTPQLDRLAQQGMRLDRFYVAFPVCYPSRANFMTGRFHHEGVLELVSPGRANILPGFPTVAHRLSEAGYRTGFIGKPHLGTHPTAWGFEQVPVMTPESLWGTSRHIDPDLIVDGVPKQVEGHVTAILADAAIDFIEDQRDRPWFLWLATTAPHVPFHAFDAYPYQAPDIVDRPPPGWPPNQSIVIGNGVYDWPAYYSTISMLDEQLGRVLHRLDTLGLSQNTLVFFTSDNGLQIGSHGYMGKAVWYDETTRVPAVVRWPGRVRAGAVSQQLVSSVDFMPTLMDLAGLPPTEGAPGTSLLPLLLRDEAVREEVYSESWRGQRDGGGRWQMIVRDRWKYVRFIDQKERYLFDLTRDPNELVNLAAEALHTQTVARLDRALDQWQSGSR